MNRDDLERTVRDIIHETPDGDFVLELFLHMIPDAEVSEVETVLQTLVSTQELSRYYRVHSTNGGGISDFEREEDIPAEIYDWRRGVMDEVKRLDVRAVYLGPQSRPETTIADPWGQE